MEERFDKIYCGAIGGISGLLTWFNEVGIDQTFIGTLIKTASVALVSTLVGLIAKEIWYKVFPKRLD